MKQKEQDGSVVPAVESETNMTNMVPAVIEEAAVPDGADEPEGCLEDLEDLQDQHGQPHHQDHWE